MQLVVVPAVIELLLDSAAHLEVQVGCYSHIAGIEQAVDIAPEQQPVSRLVFASLAVRANVRSLQHRKSPLIGGCTPPLVGICDQNTESALSQPGHDQSRISESSLCSCNQSGTWIAEGLSDQT